MAPHLVVDRQASDGSRSIAIVATDGSGDTTTLDLQGLIADYWVRPRPTDGRELIFAAYAHEGGPGNVYAIGTDGTGLRQIGELAQANNVFMSPNLSPDGRFVAYWNEEPSTDYPATQNASIHLLDLDTGIDRIVDLDPLSKAEFKPTWSPDGTSLAFVSLERNQVEIAPADGSAPAVPVGRVFAASDDYDFGFSPDGTAVDGGGVPGRLVRLRGDHHLRRRHRKADRDADGLTKHAGLAARRPLRLPQRQLSCRCPPKGGHPASV